MTNRKKSYILFRSQTKLEVDDVKIRWLSQREGFGEKKMQSPERDSPLTCVGHSVPKIDALDKVLGRAIYSEDIFFTNMLYGRVLRAGVPHAIIEEIDTHAKEVEAAGG